jgi:hypothetical protein
MILLSWTVGFFIGICSCNFWAGEELRNNSGMLACAWHCSVVSYMYVQQLIAVNVAVAPRVKNFDDDFYWASGTETC